MIWWIITTAAVIWLAGWALTYCVCIEYAQRYHRLNTYNRIRGAVVMLFNWPLLFDSWASGRLDR